MVRTPNTTRYWLNWAYTDTPNGVPTQDVFDTGGGVTIVHKAGAVYSRPGNITSETQFGDYSSVWPEYDSSGTCHVGDIAVAANESFAADGSWQTRIDRIAYKCTP